MRGYTIYRFFAALRCYWQGKGKEVEVVTIMMSLFDDEQIMKTYSKDIKRETLMEKAILMLKKGKINIDEVSEYFPELLESDIKEIEAELMQLA